jgi:TPR repeat protein
MTGAECAKGVITGVAMLVAGVATIVVAIRGYGPAKQSSVEGASCATVSVCEERCAKGRASDCLQGGLMHLQGLGTERSPARAYRLLRAACDGGDAAGCTALGALLVESSGAVGVPPSEARAIFAKACDGGDAMGCNNLANLYDDDGPARDPARARELYEKACELGSGMACSSLAKALQAGDGVPPDPAGAGRLFSRSRAILQANCQAQNPRACGQAGWLLERGLGGEKDVAGALRDYEAGCDGNDGVSCYNLALTRQAASAADPATAALLAKACKLGSAEACGAAGHRQ